jgi:hypothetical protein
LHAIATTGCFIKDDNADVRSILAGMVGRKGAVHVGFGTAIRVPDDATADSVAALIDAQIVANYRLHLVNYLAVEKLRPDFMDFGGLPALFGIGAAEVKAKRDELDRRLHALPADLHPYVLAMYANPVLRKAGIGSNSSAVSA